MLAVIALSYLLVGLLTWGALDPHLPKVHPVRDALISVLLWPAWVFIMARAALRRSA